MVGFFCFDPEVLNQKPTYRNINPENLNNYFFKFLDKNFLYNYKAKRYVKRNASSKGCKVC